MLKEEIQPSLQSLQTEIRELKQSLEELRELVKEAGIKPSEPSAISFEEAATHVRSEYSHLLEKLSQ